MRQNSILEQQLFRLGSLGYRHATRGEAGGAAAPPDFGGSVNPISTRGDTLSPPSTTCPTGFLTLVACLLYRQTNDFNDSKLYVYWCNTHDMIDKFLYYRSEPLIFKNNTLEFPSQSAYFMKNAASY